MMEEKTCLVNGVSLFYLEGPSNGKPLLLIHGITNNRHSFDSLIPLLESSFQLFLIDLRGHGKSQRITSGYKIVDMVADIEQFVLKIVLEKCFIYGHSLGGLIALKLSVDHPEIVHSIVIGDILFLINKQQFSDEALKFNRTMYDILIADRPETDKIHELQKIFGQDFAVTYWNLGLNELDPAFQKMFIYKSNVLDNFYNAFSNEEILHYITDLKIPALFLLADSNVMSTVKVDQEQIIRECNYLAVIKRVTGVTHFLHGDNPERVSQELKQFFIKSK